MVKNKLFPSFLALMFSALSSLSIAQSTNVTGTISDSESGEALPGVNIIVKGSQSSSQGVIGTQSDASGAFELNVPDEYTVLTLTYIGYVSKDITITSSDLVITLERDIVTLNEAVVVGFGSQKRANLSGAVDQVDMKNLEGRTISNVTQGLQGLIPNLNIDYTAGAPGQAPNINIRGYTSINGGEPLIIIDGIPSESRDLNTLDPMDVESISVLKDASSAAIYGARAAFGVLLVETKKGSVQQGNIAVNYSTRFSWDTPTIVPEKVTDPYVYMRWQENSADATPWDYINHSDEMYQWARERSDNPNASAPVRVNPTTQSQWQYMGNRDWSTYFLDDFGLSTNNTISLNGSTGKTRFYLSGSSDNQQGALQIDEDNFERWSVRSNVEYDLSKSITVGNRTTLTRSQRNAPSRLSGSTSAMQDVYLMNPTSWHKNPDGTWANTDVGRFASQLVDGGDWLDEYNNFQTTFTARLQVNDMISVNADYTLRDEARDYDWDYKKYAIGYGPDDVREEGNTAVYRYQMEYDYEVLNVYANFASTFAEDHSVSAIAGYNQETYDYYRLNTSITDVISSSLPSVSLSLGDPTVSDEYTGWAVRGIFGRVNYTFQDKYIVEFNGRYDGSSRFPEDDRYGFFPSGSMAWRIDQESFMDNVDVINVLKLRASIGTLGNQSVSNFGYIPNMSTYTENYLVGNTRPLAISSPGMVSSNYSWEEVTSQNLGLDIELLENRILASFDVYTRDTEGMLTLGQDLPNVLGTSEPQENAADLRTRGWEAAINYRDRLELFSDNLFYGVRFTLADSRSEITDFDNPNRNLGSYYIGQEIGEIWGLVSNGFYTSEEDIANSPDQSSLVPWGVIPTTLGTVKFQDLNGDGKITRGTTVDNPGDMKVIGNSQARYRFGVNLDFQFKGFDVRTFFQGVAKRDFYPYHYIFWGFHQQPYEGGFVNQLDYYRAADDSPELMSQHSQKYIDMGLASANTDSYYPVLQAWNMDNRVGWGNLPNTGYLLDGSYIRWKNLTVGYTIPSNLSARLGIRSVRIYVSGENLKEWSKIADFVDPEAVTNNGQGYAYPFQRRYSVGLNVTF
ncbi:MAG: TonB-dependent receptor [Balneolaceae bacterium]|nr:TonB-dependent receptor [Balneolaceae bacterium]